jgi:hypothetical protein
MSAETEILGFAIWHPKQGFHQPHQYEGPLAYVRSDDATQEVLSLNRECGQNNRTGWRIVPVMIRRKAPDPAAEQRAHLHDAERIPVLPRGSTK